MDGAADTRAMGYGRRGRGSGTLRPLVVRFGGYRRRTGSLGTTPPPASGALQGVDAVTPEAGPGGPRGGPPTIVAMVLSFKSDIAVYTLSVPAGSFSPGFCAGALGAVRAARSEEHTSELQSLRHI